MALLKQGSEWHGGSGVSQRLPVKAVWEQSQLKLRPPGFRNDSEWDQPGIFTALLFLWLENVNLLTLLNNFAFQNLAQIAHCSESLDSVLTHSAHLYTGLRFGRAALGTRPCRLRIGVLGNQTGRCKRNHRRSHGNCPRWDTALIDTHQSGSHKWHLWTWECSKDVRRRASEGEGQGWKKLFESVIMFGRLFDRTTRPQQLKVKQQHIVHSVTYNCGLVVCMQLGRFKMSKRTNQKPKDVVWVQEKKETIKGVMGFSYWSRFAEISDKKAFSKKCGNDAGHLLMFLWKFKICPNLLEVALDLRREPLVTLNWTESWIIPSSHTELATAN